MVFPVFNIMNNAMMNIFASLSLYGSSIIYLLGINLSKAFFYFNIFMGHHRYLVQDTVKILQPTLENFMYLIKNSISIRFLAYSQKGSQDIFLEGIDLSRNHIVLYKDSNFIISFFIFCRAVSSEPENFRNNC